MWQMCDMGGNKTVEHVILECEKYDSDRMDVMPGILNEMGCEMDEVVERGGREWPVLLLGLWGEMFQRKTAAVKVFLE